MTKTTPSSDTSPATARDQVFISYSHKDGQFCDQLLTHLKPLIRSGSVSAWSDQQIAPGLKWFAEIKAALDRTKVAVMLVSPNFLASDFIHEHELTPLLKEADRGGVQVLWIPIRACSYAETALKHYQAISDPAKPFARMKAERDDAWVRVCKAIKAAVAAEPNEATSGQGDGNDKRIANLIEIMKDLEADIRRAAIRKLGEIGPDANQAISPLIQAFRDSSEEVRSEAGEAVLKIGPLAIPLLVDCLTHVDPGVRGRAAGLLGRFAPPATIALRPLMKLLGDGHPGVRRTAVVAVGNFGPNAKDTVQSLGKLLHDPDRDIRRHAAEALGKIGPDAREGVDALANVLNEEPDVEVCYCLVHALGRIGPAAAAGLQTLIKAMSHQDRHVRELAAESLGSIGVDDAEGVKRLISALNEKDGIVAFNAARSLGIIKSDRAGVVQALIAALDTDIASVAAWSLGELERRARVAIPGLAEVAGSQRDSAVRQSASDALKKINPSNN